MLADSVGTAVEETLPRGMFEGTLFRAAMRHPTNAVTVVASEFAGERVGVTATAVCSLSDSPPSILACINRKSSALAIIQDSNSFSVNFLASNQVKIAEIFGGRTPLRGEDRFRTAPWTTLKTGAPILSNGLVSFDCQLDQIIEHSTHLILIGNVVDAIKQSDLTGLTYGRGSYSPGTAC
ncbi:MAG: flavin reductase family protein [Rhizobiaceae bacterium]|nr:flavin reductase family protein [Rhizobiaceae bacterium]